MLINPKFGQWGYYTLWLSFCIERSVTDPRDGHKVALKKMPNVFQNLVSCKRVFRELRMLCFFKHDNVSFAGGKGRLACMGGHKKREWVYLEIQCVCFQFWNLIALHGFCNDGNLLWQVLSAVDILQPPQIDCFEEMYPSDVYPLLFILFMPQY